MLRRRARALSLPSLPRAQAPSLPSCLSPTLSPSLPLPPFSSIPLDLLSFLICLCPSLSTPTSFLSLFLVSSLSLSFFLLLSPSFYFSPFFFPLFFSSLISLSPSVPSSLHQPPLLPTPLFPHNHFPSQITRQEAAFTTSPVLIASSSCCFGSGFGHMHSWGCQRTSFLVPCLPQKGNLPSLGWYPPVSLSVPKPEASQGHRPAAGEGRGIIAGESWWLSGAVAVAREMNP